MLKWQQDCLTISDYVFRGLQTTGVYYAASFIGLLLASVAGYLKQGMFWRYWLIASLLTVELYTVTRPAFPAVLASVVNPMLVATGLRQPYLPFQMIVLLRKAALTFGIAVSQLTPLLQKPKPAATEGPQAVTQQLDRIAALSVANEMEISRLINLELAPFEGDRRAKAELKSGVKEWLVQNTVRSDAEVRSAIDSELNRRRHDVSDDSPMR